MALNIFILFSLSLIPEAEPPLTRSQAEPGNEIGEALPRLLEALPRLSNRHSPLQCLCS